ncbi:MAG: M20/M25/M40 family metallo-hydrolase [Gammaproteobacteria bacterium]|nr:M20/M25/M40 family metallo-hydrolase [Gammaproteobacteria bacterium]
MKNNFFAISLLSLAVSTCTFAQENPRTHVLVAPQCLTQNLKSNYSTLAKSELFSLIQVDEKGLDELIHLKDHQKKACGGFMNVTDTWISEKSKQSFSPTAFINKYIPATATTQKKISHYTVTHPKEVAQLLSQINPQLMWGNLTTLSNFHDRYANSNTGVEAANWIKSQIEKLAKDNHRSDVSIQLISTGSSYKQPSVVVKIGNSTEPAIVVGAHMDTLAAYWGNMPGADDDGTGSVTVLEVARTLLSSDMHFEKPIYLIWYSAEEEGLVGSQHVVAEFKKQNIPVADVIHFDMTGYAPKNDATMWLITDNTNKDLTSYLETLINAYVKKPVKYTACGYACSDHATWTSNGYKAAIAFEAGFENYNPYIHSSEDKMTEISLDHMTDFTKLAVAFATELANPVAQ